MSNMTLINNTKHIAQFSVWKGQQVIERLPGVDPGGQVEVPTESHYTVRARVTVDGNTYTTAPQDVESGARFLAQIKQSAQEGTYDFEMVQRPGSASDELQFEKTTLQTVDFIIAKDGKPLQTIAVRDASEIVSLHIGNSFRIEAVVNGVTTRTVETSDASAVIVAAPSSSDLNTPYATLYVQGEN